MKSRTKYLVVAVAAILLAVIFLFPVLINGPECTLTVDSEHAAIGSTVSIDVKISDNPGILGAKFSVVFDEGLALIDSTSGEVFSNLTYQKPSNYVSGCNFLWYGSESTKKQDGAVLTLTFEVLESAKKDSDLYIDIIFDKSDIVDEDYQSVDVNVISGKIHVPSNPSDIVE